MDAVCYLCGHPIEGDQFTDDHVPAKQFFAARLRASQNLSRLVTLPAHLACNKAYERDEEYFLWSLAPLAVDSVAGEAVARDHAKAFNEGKSVGLALKTLKEFERNPSGLYLPDDLVLKRVEGSRIVRVAWKIVRGLYRIENREFLPDDVPFTIEVFEPQVVAQSVENELWEAVKAADGKGAYPAIFDYKYRLVEVDHLALHSWGMLFWDRLMIFIAHRQPRDRRPLA
jgi:hypothetical protein